VSRGRSCDRRSQPSGWKSLTSRARSTLFLPYQNRPPGVLGFCVYHATACHGRGSRYVGQMIVSDKQIRSVGHRPPSGRRGSGKGFRGNPLGFPHDPRLLEPRETLQSPDTHPRRVIEAETGVTGALVAGLLTVPVAVDPPQTGFVVESYARIDEPVIDTGRAGRSPSTVNREHVPIDESRLHHHAPRSHSSTAKPTKKTPTEISGRKLTYQGYGSNRYRFLAFAFVLPRPPILTQQHPMLGDTVIQHAPISLPNEIRSCAQDQDNTQCYRSARARRVARPSGQAESVREPISRGRALHPRGQEEVRIVSSVECCTQSTT
jgi:hypothetical protein